MMARILNVALMIAILVGAILAFREGSRHRQLLARHSELAAQFGNLTITDPDKLHVLALHSDDPLHFRWRIYVPANCRLSFRHVFGRNTGSSSEPRDFIAQVKFRTSPTSCDVFAKQDLGGSQIGIGNPELAALLHAHWDELEILQADQLVVDPDQVTTLLEIRMPDALAAAALAELPAGNYGRQFVPTIFTEEIGTDVAFEKRRQAKIATP